MSDQSQHPLSVIRQRPQIATRGMQLVLAGLTSYGLVIGAPKMITNAGLGLTVTFIPAALRSNSRVVLTPGLTVWITAAVCLHALGSAGLYFQVGWWDHLTHVLSATVVAAAGYVTFRAIDLYDNQITLPRRAISVYIVVFVLACGVLWEVFEFGLDIIAAHTLLTMPLSQTGLTDTIWDLTFNTVGAVVVAIWGEVYLGTVLDRLQE